MPEHQPALISALPPTPAQKQAACAVAVFLLVAFLLALPFAHVSLPKVDAFVPIVASVMFLSDAMTAVLLFGQFSVLGSQALLVLASGYLFTSFVVVFYALTFPGAFSLTGLLGAGLQSAGWLFIAWHVGLPITVIGYAILSRVPTEGHGDRTSVGPAIVASVVVVVCLVGTLTWFVTVHEDLLPVLVLNVVEVSGLKSVTLTALALSITSIVLLWVWQRSILDLWLLVVSFAWLLDSIFMIVTESRYTVAWYGNRILGISSASFVLFVLLAESLTLYARLAVSVATQAREREARRLSMDAISAALAHEIKQPLGAIATNANAGLRWLTKNPPEVVEARQTFRDIASDSHRANEVIQSVRSMFGKEAQARTALDTNELVRETMAIVRGDLEAAGVTTELQLEGRLPMVSAHPGQLQQVILNLIANAADAMRPITERARVLAVRSEATKPAGIAVSVADSGTGIDPQDVDRIFEAFFTTKANGMGMGLAICRSIVESHGGTLSVAAGSPHGSVFRIVLPSNQQ
jgi:signal transduction histidine kinase